MSDETTSPFPAPTTETADVAVPGYALGEEVGRGGMGVVYRARDVALDREVAVKLLQERYPAGSPIARRFLDEARITGQLQHPAIPPIHQAGTLPDGRPFLVMKLIKGRTLDRVLEDPGTTNVLAVFEAVCQAVGYAHSRGVLHRDLKPGNVMVGAFGEVQVMDWGLAKLLSSHERQRTEEDTPATEIRSLRQDETHAGTLLGTPAYMAPEQAAGEVEKVDARADVFGLGAILCVVLTGEPPFTGETADAVRVKAMRGDTAEALTRLAGCGAEPGLVDLCRRCLSFAPADRPADGGAVAAAVGELRRAAEERARQAEVDRARAEVQAAEERKRRRLGLALAGLVLAVLLVSGSLFAWRARGQSLAARDLESALAKAAVLQQEGKLSDALTSARQAEGLLIAAGNTGDLRERVETRVAELDLVTHLAEIRLGDQESDDHFYTRHRAETAYRSAFRQAGIDLDVLGADEAVAAISARPALQPYLLAALDDWVVPCRRAKPDTPARWGLLLEVARKLDPDPWRNQVREAVGRDDTPALVDLAATVDPKGQRVTTLNLVGEWLVLVGENAAALALLRKVHAEFPGDYSVAYLFGTWLRYHGAPDTTEEMVRVTAIAVALNPTRVGGWHRFARALQDAGRIDEALAASERGLRLRAESGLLLFHRSKMLGQIGDLTAWRTFLNQAIHQLRRQVRETPEDTAAWSTLGLALTDAGLGEEAMEAYRQAIRDPLAAWPRHNLGNRLRLQGRKEEGTAWLEQAVKLNPTSAWMRNNLGQARKSLGDRAGAIAEYQAAIRAEPWHVFPYSNLAGLLAQERRKEESEAATRTMLEQCREVLRYRPRAWEAHSVLAKYYQARGDLDAALVHVRRLFEANAIAAAGYGELSDLLHKHGLLDEVVAFDRRALQGPRYDPVELLNSLAFHLMEKGEPLAEAHEHLRQALAIDPNSTIATLTLAELYLAEGEFQASLEAYRKGHDLQRKEASQRWPTAQWVKDAERKVELDKTLPDVLAGKREPAGAGETLEYAAVCSYKGLHSDAARLYAEAFAADPTLVEKPQADRRYLAARAAVKAGGRKQALDWLRADLALWQEQAKSDRPSDQLRVRCKLNHWRTHDDLLPVRDAKALAALPETERQGWQRLWADVADLLDRLKPPPIPE